MPVRDRAIVGTLRLAGVVGGREPLLSPGRRRARLSIRGGTLLPPVSEVRNERPAAVAN
jgi:hypothetical protein